MSKKIADWQKIAARRDVDGFVGVAGRWTLCIFNEKPIGKSKIPLPKRNDSRTIAFYDTKQANDTIWPIGQFTGGSYYIETLLKDRQQLEEGGLNLHGGVEEWSASPDEMKKVFDIIEKETK
jgi:hypothetical protein